MKKFIQIIVVIFVALLALKAFDVITISWFTVFLPITIPLILGLIALALVIVIVKKFF